jgi:conjugal transfer pilus assembly protein TraV
MTRFAPRLAASAAAGAAALLAGCSSVSGLDGTSSYGCKAPEGVKCDSVSGTYYNAIQNNLPSQRRGASSRSGAPVADPAGTARPTSAMVSTSVRSAQGGEAATYVPAPLRSAPKVLRLWIKPWEDAERDLNGESLVYVQVDNGHWLVDHVQRQAREAYAAVRPPGLAASSAKEPAEKLKAAIPAATDENTSITGALRALQSRNPATNDN